MMRNTADSDADGHRATGTDKHKHRVLQRGRERDGETYAACTTNCLGSTGVRRAPKTSHA